MCNDHNEPEETEESEGCTWPVGGYYPDTPPELCDAETDGDYCPRHTAAAAAFDEQEQRQLTG